MRTTNPGRVPCVCVYCTKLTSRRDEVGNLAHVIGLLHRDDDDDDDNDDLSPVHTERVSARRTTRFDASNQTNVKDSKHSHRPSTRFDARRRASSNLHTSKERCQFKLCIGYWTSNNNKWPKCPCRYRTPSPDNTCANDVIDNDVTDNDVLTAG